MINSFYRAFEERYRGSRELIMQRLRVYEPFVQPLLQPAQPARALDLGCGRGEWLELLGQAGFDAQGVDLDDGMLAACRERGLNAIHADALATLRGCPDDSLALVSAFHLVEHIPFDDVRTLISEALRALRPGGLLVMETPNPENLVVGAGDFYNDPSHLRPIPPKLLLFAAEHAGFGRARVLRLQEAPALHEAPLVSLYDVLAGASPDFSVVAQKAAAPEQLAPFDAAFDAAFGLDLHTLAQRFDMVRDALLRDTGARIDQLADRNSHEIASIGHDGKQAALALSQLQDMVQALAAQVQSLAQAGSDSMQRLGTVETALADTLERARTAQDEALAQASEDASAQARIDARLAAVEQEAQGLQLRLRAALEHADALQLRVEQAEAASHQMGQRVVDLLASRSWRLTAPLRVIGSAARWRGAMRRHDDVQVQSGDDAPFTAQRVARGVLVRLRFTGAGRLTRHWPWLHARLLRLMAAPPPPPPPEPEPAPFPDTEPAPVEAMPPGADLSPRGLRAYRKLKRAHQNRKD